MDDAAFLVKIVKALQKLSCDVFHFLHGNSLVGKSRSQSAKVASQNRAYEAYMISTRARVLEVVQERHDLRLAWTPAVHRNTGDVLQDLQFVDVVFCSVAIGP